MSVVRNRLAPQVERWRWIVVPLAVAVISRVFSITLVLLETGKSPLLAKSSPLVAWDGQWYLGIARAGYHAAAVGANGHHDFAFHPGWPLAIRFASPDGALSMDVTAVALANSLFVLAAVAVYALFLDRFGRNTALMGTLLLCFNPAAYVFSMAYSESLFLLIAALYFRTRNGAAAPMLAGVATLVRVAGLAVGASAAAMFVLDRARRRHFLLVVAGVAVAFAAWWIYIWQLTGSFTGWFGGSFRWDQYDGIDSITFMFGQHPTRAIAWMAFVGAMLVGSALLVRTHPDMAVYAFFTIVPAVLTAAVWSMPRYSIVAFPAFAALAERLGPRLSAALVALFALGQFSFVHFAFSGRVPNPP
jgi:hypothetical protein